jgi:flagellar biosynthesis/type III secretory pathway M-ring protein FliF/YscJ
MTDVILVAAIVAFFVAAALLVRVLDRMIAHADSDTDAEAEASEAPEAPGPQPELGAHR